MTDPIVTAYRQLDAEAHNYADPELAVTTAKRRRRRMAAVASVVPVVLIGILVGAGSLIPGWGRTPSPPSLGHAAGSVTATEAAAVRPPGERVVLPRVPVGRAAYAYTPCRSGCDAFVVLTDGRQVVVPPDPGRGLSVASLSISGNGRWLGYPWQGRYVVRDLLGTRLHQVAGDSTERGPSAVAWSSDARLLLLISRQAATGSPGSYTVLDVQTGQTTAVAEPPGTRAFGILPDGTVLFRHTDDVGPAVAWSLSTGGTVTSNVAGRLKAESVRSLHLAPDDRSVYLVTARSTAETSELTAVIHVDAGGKVLGRYDIPQVTGENQYCAALHPVADGFAFACRNGSGSRTVLVTVSSTGSRTGVTVSAPEWPNAALAELEIPG